MAAEPVKKPAVILFRGLNLMPKRRRAGYICKDKSMMANMEKAWGDSTHDDVTYRDEDNKSERV
jgi:hypothetical protein